VTSLDVNLQDGDSKDSSSASDSQSSNSKGKLSELEKKLLESLLQRHLNDKDSSMESEKEEE
jgi:hypothetical protein